MPRTRKLPFAVSAVLVALLMASSQLAMRSAASSPSDLTVHEWGTFTTVSGSDGVLLPGLEAAEEELPYFVRSHDGMGTGSSKGWYRPLLNVTVRMETPVLYFYATQGLKARVDVGFDGGSISQWFPERTGGEQPPPLIDRNNDGVLESGAIDFAKGYQGAIRWDVDVLPPGDYPSSRLFHGGETLNWVLPRQTDSNLVVAKDGTVEKYLFYRGVGNFELPVVFTMPDEDTLRIDNTGRHAIGHLVVYERPAQTDLPARFTIVDDLDGGDVIEVSRRALTSTGGNIASTSFTDLLAPRDWRDHAYDAMSDALVAAGLFRKEADAMVETWWHSYFERPGLRVFWILPAAEVSRILPLSIDPAPVALARVIVGRSEILTPSFERGLVAGLGSDEGSPWDDDRFLAAFEARVQALESGASR